MAAAALLVQVIMYAGLALLVSQICAYLVSPLKHIPGPFLAKFTDLWRLLDVYQGETQLTQQALHRKYGVAVRMGPNCVSLSDPRLLNTIYSKRVEFLKSAFYNVNNALINGQLIQNIFSTRNPSYHGKYIRPIHKLYSMSTLLAFEPLVDKTVNTLLRRLGEEFVDERNVGTPCDIGDWLLYFAWDVIGDITFSKPMGYLEKGCDFDGTLARAEKSLDYFAAIGQVPTLDSWFDKNPVYRIGPPSFGPPAAFCAEQAAARAAGTDGHDALAQADFLDHFLELTKTHPETVDMREVIGYLLINILAGSDTVGISIRAVIYYVLRNPTVLAKLQRELDATPLNLPVSYKDARELKYLDAVIREAMRMHPGVGMILERVVPQGGLVLPDGRVLPRGTVVGMNPWVIHQNNEVFGPDAESFAPERWLPQQGESKVDFEKRRARMNQADLTFGAGSRACIGKNLGSLEVWKVIPTLFSVYDMVLVDPNQEWHTRNSWFVRQWGIRVTLKPRRKPRW